MLVVKLIAGHTQTCKLDTKGINRCYPQYLTSLSKYCDYSKGAAAHTEEGKEKFKSHLAFPLSHCIYYTTYKRICLLVICTNIVNISADQLYKSTNGPGRFTAVKR